MKKVEKGGYGYFAWEKKRRAAMTFVMFLLPAVLFVIGYVQTGTRKNLFTIAAILVCLPACRSFVGWVMMLPRRSMGREEYESILAHAGRLTMAYDLYFTTYEENMTVDAVAVCGNKVVGYCSRRQGHRRSMEEHIRDTIHKNGYPVTVRLMEDLQPFLRELDPLDGGRTNCEEQIRQILLAITL